MSLWTRFCAVVAQSPGATALHLPEGGRLTYAQLRDSAAALSETLAALPPSRIGILCERAETGIIALLAIASSPHTAVLLDAHRPQSALSELSLRSDCALHLIDGARRWSANDCQVIVGPTATAGATSPSAGPHAPSSRPADAPFYVIFTSGSTGSAKGILQSERNLLEHIDVYAASIAITPQDIVSLLPIMACDAGLMDVFVALLNGCTLVPICVRSTGLPQVAHQLRARSVSIVHGTPSLIQALATAATSGLPSVRSVVFGGESLRPTHLTELKGLFPNAAHWINGFGPTECTVVCQSHFDIDRYETGDIGRPVQGVEVVLEPDTGRLIIVSDRLALGALDEADNDAFFIRDGRRAYRTGDAARQAADGRYLYAGRLDGRAKVRGLFVDLRALEAALERAEGVGSAFAAVRPDGALHAWVTGVPAVDLRTHLLEHLAAHEVPTAIHQVEVLPRTGSAKVDARRLMAPSRSPDATIETLREVAQTMGLGRWPTSASFFEIGGDSLSFMVFCAALGRRFACEVQLSAECAALPLSALRDELQRADWTASSPHEGTQEDHSLTAAEVDFWLSETLSVGRQTPRVQMAFTVAVPLDLSRLSAAFERLVTQVPKLSRKVVEHPTPHWAPSCAPTLSLAPAPPDWQQTPLSCIDGPSIAAWAAHSQGETCFRLVAHHIYLDGFAVRAFVRRWMALYDTPQLTFNAPPRPKASPLAVRWWARYLGKARPVRLPTLSPGGPIPTAIGGCSRKVLKLGEQLQSQLAAVGEQHGMAPYAVWALATAAAVRAVTGQANIALATVASGRDGGVGPDEVGCFINTLYARCSLIDGATHRSLVARFIDGFRPALTYQRVSRQALHAELDWPTEGVNVPDVYLSYHAWRTSTLTVAGQTVHPSPVPSDDLRVPLSIDVTRDRHGTDEQTRVVISHDPTRLSASVYSRFEQSLLDSLHAFVGLGPEHYGPPPAGVLEGATPQAITLTSWQDAKPDAVALIDGQRVVSYGTLNQKVEECTRQLKRSGVKPGQLLAILGDDAIACAIAWLACWQLEIPFVTLGADWPMERVMTLLNHYALGPVLDVSHAGLPAPIPTLQTSTNGAWRRAPTGQIAYGYFTSGTTGVPRLALCTRPGFLNRLQWMESHLRPTADLCVMRTTPAHYDSALWQVLWPLMTGGTVVLPAPGLTLDAERVLDSVIAHQVTVIDFVPSVLAAIAPHFHKRAPSLERVILGGEALQPQDLPNLRRAAPNARIYNTYGTTEATIGSVCRQVDQAQTSLGRPIDGTLAAIIGPDDVSLPPHNVGEIALGGLCVGWGYLDDPAATSERYFESKGVRWFRTGDRGYIDEAGDLHCLGRIDHQIKRNGVRLDLDGLAANVCRVTAVTQAAACFHEDVLAVFVVDGDPNTLEAELRRHLPSSHLPDRLLRIDALPLTAMGKLDRHALAQQIPAAQTPPIEPISDALSVVRTIWGQLLKRDVPADATFFELGGHSLLALKAAQALSAAFGQRISVATLFRFPRVLDLSAHLDTLQRHEFDV